MTTRYYTTSTNAGAVQVTHNKALATSASGSATDLSDTAIQSEIQVVRFKFVLAPGLTTWDDGTYTAVLNVIAAGSNTTYYAGLYRRPSDESFNRSGVALPNPFTVSGTGIKTWNYTGTTGGSPTSTTFNTNPAGSVSSDVLAIRVYTTNASMMFDETITLRVDTTDSYLDVPWTVSGPPPDTSAMLAMF